MMRRSDIPSGLKTNSLDIGVIRKAAASASTEMMWDTFFVVAARSNARDVTEIGTGKAQGGAWPATTGS